MPLIRLNLKVHDGRALVGYRFDPPNGTAPNSGVVIAPAMATPQSFYAAFAAHLAAQDDMVWSSIPAIPVNRCKVACAAPSRISPTGSHAITTPSWRYPERRDAAVAALVPHADYLLTGEPGAREAYASATFG